MIAWKIEEVLRERHSYSPIFKDYYLERKTLLTATKITRINTIKYNETPSTSHNFDIQCNKKCKALTIWQHNLWAENEGETPGGIYYRRATILTQLSTGWHNWNPTMHTTGRMQLRSQVHKNRFLLSALRVGTMERKLRGCIGIRYGVGRGRKWVRSNLLGRAGIRTSKLHTDGDSIHCRLLQTRKRLRRKSIMRTEMIDLWSQKGR